MNGNKYILKLKKWIIKKLGGVYISDVQPKCTYVTKRPVGIQAVQRFDRIRYESSEGYKKMFNYKTNSLLMDEICKVAGAIKTDFSTDLTTNEGLIRKTIYIIPFEEVEK